MTFNFPMQFLIELYLELAVVVWLNMYAGLRFDNSSQITANVLAIVVFFCVTAFPVLSYAIIMANFDKL